MVEATSTVAFASVVAFPASVYPSGRDHQLLHPHVLAAAAVCDADGSGGNGGSSTVVGVGGSSTLSGFGVGFGMSSTRPSEETLTCVMAAGMTLLLLELRLVRNFLGDSSWGCFASSPGSSLVAPPLTPMLSFAVWTMAGALDRQLPDPDSHLLPRGVSEPVEVGVVVPTEDVESATCWSEVVSAGACVLGLDFLRGIMPAAREKKPGRRRGLYLLL